MDNYYIEWRNVLYQQLGIEVEPNVHPIFQPIFQQILGVFNGLQPQK